MVLKSKKAICGGYANLFQEICSAAGPQGLVVSGVSKQDSDNCMLAMQQHLEACQRITRQIPASDPDWRLAQKLQQTAAGNLSICKEVLTRNTEKRRKLKE